MWGLYWAPYALLHSHSLFLTNYLVYPKGVNLMWNTTIIGPALLLAPITLALGVVFSYNLLATLAIAVSAFVGYLAIKRFTSNTWACFSGGLLFGFSPYMISQSLGHLNLTMNWYPPIVLVFLDLFLLKQDKRKSLGILFGILTAFQLITGEELLATSAIVALVLLIVSIILFPRKTALAIKNSWLNISLSVFTASLLSAYPLYIQFFGPRQIKGPIQAKNVYVTDLANLITPTQMNYFSSHWASINSSSFTGNISEWSGYLGIPLIVIFFLFSIWFWGKPLIRISSIFSIFLIVLSMGSELHFKGHLEKIYLPWNLVQNLPIFNNILPGRLMNYAFLSIAILLSVSMAELTKRYRFGKILSGVMIASCLIPLVPAAPYPSSLKIVPSFFTSKKVKIIPIHSVVFLAPYSPPMPSSLWQIESKLRFKMPEGPIWTSYNHGKPIFGTPPGLLRNEFELIQSRKDPIPEINKSLISQMRKELRQISVKTIIVGPFGPPSDQLSNSIKSLPSSSSLKILMQPVSHPVTEQRFTLELFTLILQKKPRFIAGVYIWRNIPSLLNKT